MSPGRISDVDGKLGKHKSVLLDHPGNPSRGCPSRNRNRNRNRPLIDIPDIHEAFLDHVARHEAAPQNLNQDLRSLEVKARSKLQSQPVFETLKTNRWPEF